MYKKQKIHTTQIYVIADEIWKDPWKALPKARLLQGIFMDLKLFGNIKWLDDKHGERNHQERRRFLVRHNNNKSDDNLNLMQWEAKQAMLTHCLNGGRWGQHLQHQFGEKVLQWKDPNDCTQPHPIIAKYLWPLDQIKQPKVCVRKISSESDAKNKCELKLLLDREYAGLIDILNETYGLNLDNVNDIDTLENFKIYKIYSWSLHDGLKSALFNTNNKNFKNATLLLHENTVVITKIFVKINYNEEDLLIMCGDSYNVYNENNCEENFVEKSWHAWDYIKKSKVKKKWHEMNDIDESVMLVHEHVKPSALNSHASDKESLPNIIDVANTLFENNDYNLEMVPCGFLWQCKKHCEMGCTHNDCIQSQKKESNIWCLKRYCNEKKSEVYRIWTSKFGFLPALGDDHNLKNEKCVYWYNE